MSVPLPKYVLALLGLFAIGMVNCHTARAQSQSERFWLAGRYDWNRVLIYFDSVQFGDSFPTQAEKIPCPVQIGLFCPVKLPARVIEQFDKGPGAERFALGDKYDLFVDGNSIATVTLTTLVGFESDEGVGNDSFIGALGTLEKDKEDWLYFAKSYLAVRRHREIRDEAKTPPKPQNVFACLLDEPVQFDIQKKIADLLHERMTTMLNGAKRREAENNSPSLVVQPFRLADGSLRYYARAGWKTGEGPGAKLIFALGAWIAPLPTVHIQAVESKMGFEYLPDLLNVIDLRNSETAIVISEHGVDSGAISLVEFRDGTDLSHMRILQSIGAGE